MTQYECHALVVLPTIKASLAIEPVDYYYWEKRKEEELWLLIHRGNRFPDRFFKDQAGRLPLKIPPIEECLQKNRRMGGLSDVLTTIITI